MNEFIRCCPFCGSHEVDICRTNKDACWVKCANCAGETESTKKRSDAIKKWNNRYFDDEPASIILDDESDHD